MKRLMITKNSIKKIQNPVLNPKSQPAKSNPVQDGSKSVKNCSFIFTLLSGRVLHLHYIKGTVL